MFPWLWAARQLGSGPTLLIIVSKIELSSFDIEKHQHSQNSEKAISHFADVFGSRHVNKGSPHIIRTFIFINRVNRGVWLVKVS